MGQDSVATVNPDGATYTDIFVTGVELPGGTQGSVRALKGTITKAVMDERKSLLASEGTPEELGARLPQMAPGIPLGFRCLISVPLIYGDRPLGAFHLRSNVPYAYSLRDVALLEKVAAHLAPAIANAALYEGARREAAETLLLNDIGRVISSSLDIDTVYDAFALRVRGLVPWDRIVVAVAGVDGSSYTDAYMSGIELPGSSKYGIRPMAGSITQQVMTQRKGLVACADTAEGLASRFPDTSSGIPHGLCSMVSVPLIYGDRALGAFHLRSKVPNAYSSNDLSVLERVAAHLAPAIANATMYEAIRREAEERRVLAEVGRSVAASLDINVIYETVADALSRIIPYDRMVVAVVHGDGKTTEVMRVFGVEVEGHKAGDIVVRADNAPVLEGPIPGTVLVKGDEGDRRGPGWAYDVGLMSWAQVPFGPPHRPIGLLSLRSRNVGAYSQRDLALLFEIAAQVTPAVVNARLYEETVRHAREASVRAAEDATLAAISRAAATSLDIAEVIARSGGGVGQLVPADYIGVNLVNSDGETFHAYAMKGGMPRPIPDPTHAPLEGSLTQAVMTTGSTLVFAGSDYEPGSHPELPALAALARNGIMSSITVPLRVENRAIGGLAFLSRQPDAFGEQHVALSEKIATHLAGALANAELHSRAIRLAEESAARIELERENERLNVSSEVKSRVIANVSHELRTPLTSMMAFADLLARNRKGNLTPEQLDRVHLIQRGGRHLDMLISDLLTMSRLETGNFKLNLEPFDVGTFLEYVSSMMTPIYETKDQSLVVEFNSPSAQIVADRQRLVQVICNLLSNASKYSGEKSTVWLSGASTRERFEVHVRDQGVGLSDAQQAGLFTRFYRADNDSTRTNIGTGLGLHIAKSIVELHGGTIRVQSAPGAGSTFSFWVPAAPAPSVSALHSDGQVREERAAA